MSKRREWQFQATDQQLAEASHEKAVYHNDRARWWQEQRSIVNDQIQESGVQVRSHPVTGGERHEVVLDATLAARLSECDRKIQDHNHTAAEYRQWHDALTSGIAGTSRVLDHDDWLFFFGDNPADDPEEA